MLLKEDTLTVAEAARVLGVTPATLRRRVARGTVAAQRDAANRPVFRRSDLVRGGQVDFSVFPSDPSYWPSPVLTPEQRERGLAAMARLRELNDELLAERGGRPFSPSSLELLDEARDERTRQLG